MSQEWIAFALVAAAAAWLIFRFYRNYLAAPLSAWLLRRGKVKWAMRVRQGFWSGRPGKKRDCCE